MFEEIDCGMDRLLIDLVRNDRFLWFVELFLLEFMDEGWDFGFLSFFRDFLLDELLVKREMNDFIILLLLLFLFGVFCLFDLL